MSTARFFAPPGAKPRSRCAASAQMRALRPCIFDGAAAASASCSACWPLVFLQRRRLLFVCAPAAAARVRLLAKCFSRRSATATAACRCATLHAPGCAAVRADTRRAGFELAALLHTTLRSLCSQRVSTARWEGSQDGQANLVISFVKLQKGGRKSDQESGRHPSRKTGNNPNGSSISCHTNHIARIKLAVRAVSRHSLASPC